MQAYVWWWILAAVLVGVELTSGTFYLLVYGIAAAAAGVAAWLGAGFVVQLLTAGVIAALGTLALRHWKRSTDASGSHRAGHGHRPDRAGRVLAG